LRADLCGPLPYIVIVLAVQAGALDQAAPARAALESPGDRFARRQLSVRQPVGQGPLPCLPLKPPGTMPGLAARGNDKLPRCRRHASSRLGTTIWRWQVTVLTRHRQDICRSLVLPAGNRLADLAHQQL
jgi:hypothetical protein